ncbi:MAG TPA: endonuclease [Candidatus Wildermuthbacteria bacterium]|nr:endonuclease [Candidatus Wildermuthbacteria bacterium]
MLKSLKSRWYYVGSTNRLEKRLDEHNAGRVTSTKHYIPLELAFTKEFSSEKEAREYEKKLKHKRTEKEAILRKIENKD